MLSMLKINLKDTKEEMARGARLYLWNIFKNEISRLKTILDFSLDDWK